MSKIKIFAKSRVNLSEKVGAYAYILDDMIAQKSGSAAFKKSIKTMAQADCAAYLNALSNLSGTQAAQEVECLEIITDSGVVIELLDTFKFQKHCEEIATLWREKVKPMFLNLKEMKFIKIERIPLAGDPHTFNMQKCEVAAVQALNKYMDLTR